MENLLLEILAAVLLFISTNIDDLFVIIAFLSDPRFKKSDVIVGQFAGIAFLTLASFFAANQIPGSYLRIISAMPIALGIYKVWSALNITKDNYRFGARGMLTVASFTMANGFDNIICNIPIFAGQSKTTHYEYFFIFMVMVGVWCGFGWYLVNHALAGKCVRRFGMYFLPWILIAMGAYRIWRLY